MTTPSRIGIIHLALAAFVVAILIKAARVQLGESRKLTASALYQQSTTNLIPASRGEILDARGEPLAQSRETVKLDVAPREVRDVRKLRVALERANIPRDWVERATDTTRKWVSLPGRYLAIDVAQVAAMRGVRATPVIERADAFSSGTRRIIGRVDDNGKAVDGVELALDSLLAGAPGNSIVMRDARGRRFESPNAPTSPAMQGNTVVLTINQELQEIAERALDDAVARMGAEGGDVVVIDPANGEVLALAGNSHDPRSTSSSALTIPYEPGSVMKPFIAATLLEHGKAKETDIINSYGGTLTINGRVVHDDEYKAPQYSLADVIRYSSNVGIVQFAERLTPREEFEGLRDFGFGTPTGVQYPVEASGTLRDPARWSKQSPNSMAMGYEVAVTPLQLAAAYGAIANGGELLEPTLVREIRAPDGRVLYHHERRVVRRVLTPDVAQRVRTMLLGVVQGGGTAKRADLGSYDLAGKTGTARRTVHGKYAAGEHIPTFVGLFPADNPQFVILVKLDNPKGAYMGGLTAAPVTKSVLEAALASRNASLNRNELAASRHDRRDSASTKVGLKTIPLAAAESTTSAQREASRLASEAADDNNAGTTPFVATLPASPPPTTPPLPPRAIPDVRGLSLRQAVLALHAAGFRVQLVTGSSGSTVPVAGANVAAGSLVQLAGAP